MLKILKSGKLFLCLKAAKKDIDKINQNADEKKKYIVVKLAKDLEDKVPKDTICMEIVRRLKDKVSDAFIRNCLPEEYKQGYRIKNAKNQKKKNMKEINLAPLVVLNQQQDNEVDEDVEKQNNQAVVMIGAVTV
jgi:hypothetical protein